MGAASRRFQVRESLIPAQFSRRPENLVSPYLGRASIHESAFLAARRWSRMKSAVAPTVLVLALLAVLLAGGPISAFHGFGGGRGGGGSHEEFHEVGGRGSSAEFHEADCGDYGRGHREDEGREESFGRTP